MTALHVRSLACSLAHSFVRSRAHAGRKVACMTVCACDYYENEFQLDVEGLFFDTPQIRRYTFAGIDGYSRVIMRKMYSVLA